jgi:predicted TIM-barrel fold metal-dependent hydrolase
MLNAGTPTYGPSKAALEALCAIMAKDLNGTGVTVNVLVPGGITNTPMVSDEAGFDRAKMIQPEVTGRRFLAVHWDPALSPEQAAETAGAPVAWFSLWEEYMDPALRERRPRMVIDENGKERLSVEGKLLGNPRGVGSLGAVGVRQGAVKLDSLRYVEGRKGGFDPRARIVDMDLDGIDAAFLYPSLGLFAGAVADHGLAAAMCRADNRWLADYCKPYPDRLFGVAMLPMQSVDLAIEEMRYAREALGIRGGFLRPNPYGNRTLHDPAYEPFWTMAEELDFSIGFHEGSTTAMPTVGVDRFDDRAARHMISHTMEMMLAAMSVIWGGVVERHPLLRIAFLESGGGWIAPWLDRMDRHFDDQGFNDSGLKTRPSEL